MTIKSQNTVYCLGDVEALFQKLELQDQTLEVDNKYYSATIHFTTTLDNPVAIVYHLSKGEEYPAILSTLDAEIKMVVGEKENETLSVKCLEDGFEYIPWESEEGGKGRIVECLEAHAWPEMLVKGSEVDSEEELSLFGKDLDSFERSIETIQELRSRMKDCDPDERYELAERIAKAFDLTVEDEFDDFVAV